MTRPGSRSRQLALDAALTAAVFGFSVAQMATEAFGAKEGQASDGDVVGAAVCLLAALPLLARHRAPRAALAAVLAGSVALVALDLAVLTAPAPAIVLATLAARDRSRQDALVVLGVCVAAFAAFAAVASVRFEPEAGEYAITALLWAGGWIVSDRRRLARERAAQEREQAAQERERVAREQRLAVAEERTRIARELHDSAGHAINSILIQAGAARLVQDSQPERSREAIATIEAIARETMQELDAILGGLRDGAPADLEPLPGIDRIPALVERHRAAGLDFSLHDRTGPALRLPPAVDRAAYRIAQEAMTNAARHGAGAAELTLECRDGVLALTVVNPVAGGAPARPSGGHGLTGMRERAALLGGTLDARSVGGRFEVRATLPRGARTP
ncbi:sensor histidine kinase [Conexibacter sp. SYSU D00693]|uniref:sensor histidine kinase n=1 Tax=Conexibacter sp. SYSU D00693 TaxID=2812560 RepID=UPI001F11B06B|nr:sensor histidine kinase [Conexibacter sp. SYSU D00693]